MLAPQSRRNLMEILRPDDGYTLDYAIGTSYSLDLLAALTVPLAFSIFGWHTGEEVQETDPIQLLDVLHRHANRILIFCQAGQIQLPPLKQPLLAYLEQSIIEVNSPKKRHVFHPKVWVLRYRATSEGEDEQIFRLLCLSRNLTYDQSWDTALVLDGRKRNHSVAASEPLARFISTLPNLANYSLADAKRTAIFDLAEQLRTVEFVPPDGFSSVSFYPLGTNTETVWPFDEHFHRIGIVSPFVRPNTLTRLIQDTSESYLVSQVSDLQHLGQDVLQRFSRVCVLNDAAQPEPEDEDSDSLPLGDQPATQTSSDLLAVNNNLHAKFYIAEGRELSWLWTGSANATNAAFDGNIEFLVKLTANRENRLLDALLDSNGLGSLLLPYQPPEPLPVDEAQQLLDRLLDIGREQLRRVRLTGHITAQSDLYDTVLTTETQFILPQSISARCWPITRHISESVELPSASSNGDEIVHFIGSFESITSFFAVQLQASQEGRTAQTILVLNIPLSGMPEDRDSRLLESILTDRHQLYRLLLLLLAEYVDFDPGIFFDTTNGNKSRSWHAYKSIPLFEAMIRALHRRPANLDAVAQVLGQLQQTASGQELLHEELMSIWSPIWEVRSQLMQEDGHEAR